MTGKVHFQINRKKNELTVAQPEKPPNPSPAIMACPKFVTGKTVAGVNGTGTRKGAG